MKFIVTERALSLFTKDGPLTLQAADNRWGKALEYIREKNEAALIALLKPAATVKQYLSTCIDFSNVRFEVDTSKLYIDDLEYKIPSFVERRLLYFATNNLPVEPLLKAIYKLKQNPSYSVRERLIEFLERGDLPFTENGNFVAYKKINADWTDIFTSKIKHELGKPISMPRSEVDDNPNNTCSSGLHVCNFEYLPSYGTSDPKDARVIAVEIDPADVVSIPTDYNETKMRVCHYVVLSEIKNWKDQLRGKGFYKPENWIVCSHNELGDSVYWDGNDRWVMDRNQAAIYDSADDANEAILDFNIPNDSIWAERL